MTNTTAARTTSGLRAIVPQASVLFIVAAVAWIVVVQRSGGTAGGTMGMALPAFLGMWALMMAAMMFPAIAPLASVYVQTIESARLVRIAAFAAGYLIVWTAAGIPAFAIAWGIDRALMDNIGLMKALPAVAYGVCGIYQLTPLKDVCLKHCRSPIAHLLKFGTYTGPLRDARAGFVHGGWCLACCWGLMVVLFALGVMNIAAMVALAAIITLEKLSPWPVVVSRVVGVVALGLAVASVWVPALAPALHPTGASMGGMKM